MSKSVTKRLKDGLISPFVRLVPRHLLVRELARRQIRSFKDVYGGFEDGVLFAHQALSNKSGESGSVRGEFAHALQLIAKPDQRLLLAGERRSAKSVYRQASGVADCQIATAGIHEDMDYFWNFEESPPCGMGGFDMVASHAIIEHLVDPFKHLMDCHELLNPGGHLVVHTVIPGFKYHRYPVDCLRFFPDWFEVVAGKMGARVVFRSLSADAHIVYVLQKALKDQING